MYRTRGTGTGSVSLSLTRPQWRRVLPRDLAPARTSRTRHNGYERAAGRASAERTRRGRRIEAKFVQEQLATKDVIELAKACKAETLLPAYAQVMGVQMIELFHLLVAGQHTLSGNLLRDSLTLLLAQSRKR